MFKFYVPGINSYMGSLVKLKNKFGMINIVGEILE